VEVATSHNRLGLTKPLDPDLAIAAIGPQPGPWRP
jgi:hypothetical protein